MQRLVNRNVAFAAIMVLFSIGAWTQAAALPERAAVFPRLVVGLLILFSVIYLVRSLWLALPEKDEAPFFINLPRFLTALLIIVAYLSAFPHVGFFTTTLFFIPIFSLAIGLRDIAGVLLGSTAFTLGAWVVFVVLLDRRLPQETLLMTLIGGGP